MEDTKSKIYLSWENIEELVDFICDKFKERKFSSDSIMGLPRGGLIPAVMLSHKLNLPLVFEPTRKTLIVDDICDSGKTFLEIIKLHPYNMIVSLHFKPHTSKFIPDLYGCILTSDDWLVYPWENRDAKAIQDYLK